MYKFIRSLTIYAWIHVNSRNLLKIVACILIIFLVSFVYQKWENYYLATDPANLFIPLSVYTLFLVFLVLSIIFYLSKFIFLKKPQKAIASKESFANKPDKFQQIRDVRLRPNLQSKQEKND